MGMSLAGEGQTQDGEFLYQAVNPWNWVAVEGTPCCSYLDSFFPGGTSLCEIPIKVGANIWKIRIGYSEENGIVIYGVWDGSEYIGERFSRNMKTIDQMVGQNFQLIYPVADTEEVYFKIGEENTFYRNIRLSREVLPAGTYYLEYLIMDMFQRTIPMERIEVIWDGEKLTMAEGTEWEGTVRLEWNGDPVI